MDLGNMNHAEQECAFIYACAVTATRAVLATET